MSSEPTMDAAQTIERYRAHVSEGMAGLAELMDAHVEVRSEGTKIWDEQGTEYLDVGGYGVFILGHRHPVVTAAVHRQLDRHPLASRTFLEPVTARWLSTCQPPVSRSTVPSGATSSTCTESIPSRAVVDANRRAFTGPMTRTGRVRGRVS